MFDPAQLIRLNRLCNGFIYQSLVWFLLGIAAGFLKAFNLLHLPGYVHAHLVVIGFVVFLIYGIGYKLIPTMFAGQHHLETYGAAKLHLYLATFGMIGQTVGGYFITSQPALGGPIFGVGSILQAIGAVLFCWQVWVMLRKAG